MTQIETVTGGEENLKNKVTCFIYYKQGKLINQVANFIVLLSVQFIFDVYHDKRVQTPRKNKIDLLND